MGKRLERRETAGTQFDRADAVNQPGHRRVGSEMGQRAFGTCDYRAFRILSGGKMRQSFPLAGPLGQALS
jgi:hypothetical protein